MRLVQGRCILNGGIDDSILKAPLAVGLVVLQPVAEEGVVGVGIQEAGDYEYNVTLADGRILMPLEIKWFTTGDTAGVLVAELIAVQEVRDGVTDLHKLGGAAVADEAYVAVAVTVIGSVAVAALLHQVKTVVDAVGVAQLVDGVNRAGLQGVKLGGGGPWPVWVLST